MNLPCPKQVLTAARQCQQEVGSKDRSARLSLYMPSWELEIFKIQNVKKECRKEKFPIWRSVVLVTVQKSNLFYDMWLPEDIVFCAIFSQWPPFVVQTNKIKLLDYLGLYIPHEISLLNPDKACNNICKFCQFKIQCPYKLILSEWKWLNQPHWSD